MTTDSKNIAPALCPTGIFINVRKVQRLLDDAAEQDPPSPDLKWIYRSALQKAVRRGQGQEAIKQALRLSGLDQAYVFRSLAVISVEDVGDPELVAWSLMLSRSGFRRSVRDQATSSRSEEHTSELQSL